MILLLTCPNCERFTFQYILFIMYVKKSGLSLACRWLVFDQRLVNSRLHSFQKKKKTAKEIYNSVFFLESWLPNRFPLDAMSKQTTNGIAKTLEEKSLSSTLTEQEKTELAELKQKFENITINKLKNRQRKELQVCISLRN